MLNSDPLAQLEPLIGRVHAYVAYRMGDGPDADDVTSEVFERALRYRASFDPRIGSPATWLIGIARRCIGDAAGAATPVADEELAEQAAPGELADDTARRLDLVSAIRRLEERDQELIALRFGADLKTKQIAELLELTPNAVDVAVHRALNRLRDRLEPAPAEGETSTPPEAEPFAEPVPAAASTAQTIFEALERALEQRRSKVAGRGRSAAKLDAAKAPEHRTVGPSPDEVELERRRSQLAALEQKLEAQAAVFARRDSELRSRIKELEAREAQVAKQEKALRKLERQLTGAADESDRTRGALAERERAAKERERDLTKREQKAEREAAARESSLRSQSEKLDARARDLAERAQELERSADVLAARERALAAALAGFDERMEVHGTTEAELETRQRQAAAEEKRRAGRLERREQSLIAREEQVTARDATVSERLQLVARREQDVEARERDLTAREHELAERERHARSADAELSELLRTEASRRTPARAAGTNGSSAAANGATSAASADLTAPAAEDRRALLDAETTRWSLADLRKLVDRAAGEFPHRVEEWEMYVSLLSRYADDAGRIPPEFDWLIEDTFAEILEARGAPAVQRAG